jgi:hypothetical protein
MDLTPFVPTILGLLAAAAFWLRADAKLRAANALHERATARQSEIETRTQQFLIKNNEICQDRLDQMQAQLNTNHTALDKAEENEKIVVLKMGEVQLDLRLAKAQIMVLSGQLSLLQERSGFINSGNMTENKTDK